MYSAASSAAASAASEPYFRSHARTYRIKVGDAVTLSCNVENLGEQNQAAILHSTTICICSRMVVQGL